jgi:hypothetical protein
MEEEGASRMDAPFFFFSEKLANKKAGPYETVDKVLPNIQYRHSP